jgi:hypothetical protein
VPGLSEESYGLTLILSIAGGVVFGFSLRLQPRRWYWPVVFSPLWGALFFSFGLGPVLSRTTGVQPASQNTAAFLSAAAVFGTVFNLAPSGPLTSPKSERLKCAMPTKQQAFRGVQCAACGLANSG